MSVVVATYNSGPKLEPLLASLHGQSLAQDRFEVIAVDDGSTDDTWQRLQEAQSWMPSLRIERIPNSGWPSRPRNIGTDLARGRYVFYADHDDEFFPEALERMVQWADHTSADLVIGKEIRGGAALGVGQELFFRNHERARLFDDHVLSLMTPHRLFRLDFLREQGIRFPEDVRRLEDHVLLAEVYTRTDRIAVLADYPCYRWIIYPDQSNNSSELGDPHVFFAALEQVFDVLDRADVSAERRDDLYRFWFTSRMLKRLSGVWFEQWEAGYRDQVIEVIRELAERRVPDRVDAGIEPVYRRRADLLRRGDGAGLVALGHAQHRVHLRIDTAALHWSGTALRIDVSVTLVDRDERPIVLVQEDGNTFWADDEGRAYDLAPYLGDAALRLFLRQRPSGVEWYADGSAPLVVTSVAGEMVLTGTGTFVVDPDTFAFGHPLEDGVWAVYADGRAFGYHARVVLRDLTAEVGPGDRPVLPTVDKQGRFILRVGSSHAAPTVQSSNAGRSGRWIRRVLGRAAR